MTVGVGTDLWVQQNIIRNHFIAFLFGLFSFLTVLFGSGSIRELNQARLSVKELGNQPSYIAFDPQFVLASEANVTR